MVTTSNELTPEDVQQAVIDYVGIQKALKALYDERDRTFAVIYSHMTGQKANQACCRRAYRDYTGVQSLRHS